MRMSRRAGLLSSGNNEFIWDVYNASYGYTVIEQSGSGGSIAEAIYVGSSYSLNQSTGVFTVSQTTKINISSSGASTALNKYFILDEGYYPTYSGTATGDVIYQIISASYTLLPNRLTLVLIPIVSEYYEYKGSLVNSVTSSVLTTYPTNGIQGNYWYVLRNKATQASISYSGNYTDEIVSMGDNYYRLLTFTSSGTLSLDRSLKGDVWICGGGGSGYQYSTSSGTNLKGDGGAGAYTDESTNSLIKDIVITIGSGYGGNSSITGDITLSAYGGNKNSNGSSTISTGGTGAGHNTYGSSIGKGDGIEKTPFSSSYFEYPYCDGGGSGGIKPDGTSSKGGAGGTNGGDGSYKVTGSFFGGSAGGDGGGHYGGAGSTATSGAGNNNGSNATGYGSGGGGGSYYYTSSRDYTGYGGYGYQGVCFIRFSL